MNALQHSERIDRIHQLLRDDSSLDNARDGAAMIAVERQRQVAKGFDATHDDAEECEGQLADAAFLLMCRHAAIASYTRPAGCWQTELSDKLQTADPIKRLTIAGALIAAEIDRLRRKAGV